MLVSLSLSLFFPLFFFFSCWLSSTYDLIWIFVAFLTAIGVVSLKSDFASQYQNCNFMIRYLIIAHARCFIVVFLFFSIYSFLHLFTFCFALIFLAGSFILVRVTRELTTLSQTGANKVQRVRLDGALYFFINSFKRILIGQLSTSVTVNLSSRHIFSDNLMKIGI